MVCVIHPRKYAGFYGGKNGCLACELEKAKANAKSKQEECAALAEAMGNESEAAMWYACRIAKAIRAIPTVGA